MPAAAAEAGSDTGGVGDAVYVPEDATAGILGGGGGGVLLPLPGAGTEERATLACGVGMGNIGGGSIGGGRGGGPVGGRAINIAAAAAAAAAGLGGNIPMGGGMGGIGIPLTPIPIDGGG